MIDSSKDIGFKQGFCSHLNFLNNPGNPGSSGLYCNQNRGVAAPCLKAMKKARLVESLLYLGEQGRQMPLQRLTTSPSPDHREGIAFIGWEGVLQAEQHSQIWQSSWNWSSVAWPALSKHHLGCFRGTVYLQLQGWFVPISFRPTLGIVAAYVMAIVRSSCS